MKEVTAGGDAPGPQCLGAMSGVCRLDPPWPPPVAYRPDPGELEFAASRCTRSPARHAQCCGFGCSAKAPEVMTTQVLASNTKTPQVREPEKINTGTTRTKRHYPAHDNTAASMAA